MVAMRALLSAVALMVMMISASEGLHTPGAAQTVNDFSFELQVSVTMAWVLWDSGPPHIPVSISPLKLGTQVSLPLVHSLPSFYPFSNTALHRVGCGRGCLGRVHGHELDDIGR